MEDNQFDPGSRSDSDRETGSSQNTQQNSDPFDRGAHSTDDYNPNQAYNYKRAHTEPERDAKGHPLPPQPQKPNNLAVIALAASVATIFLCCCNPYASILSSIMGLTLGICSRFFNNDEKRWYPHAIAAIVISSIALILIFGSILITYVLVPYLLETSPEFKEYYDQITKLLWDALEQQGY